MTVQSYDHGWNVTPKEAFQIQKDLRERVVLENSFEEIGLIAGADVAFSEKEKKVFAAVVLLNFQTMELVERASALGSLTFPYIPGLLSFREGPALLEAFRNLRNCPDLIIFDGQGIAHPRGLGLASHMGVLLGTPSIGCAKSKLIGDYQEPGPRRGMSSDLLMGKELVGVVLRTKDNVKPVFVSPGHLIDISTSVEIVLRCCRRYRLPEPTRLAHMEVEKLKGTVARKSPPEDGEKQLTLEFGSQ